MAHVTSPPCAYEELAHTADIGMRVQAATPEQLFACAAYSLVQVSAARPGAPTDARHIAVYAPDAAALLVAWLNELLYLSETSGTIVAAVQISAWTPEQLTADVQFAPPAAPPQRAIKAVTYHGLCVDLRPDACLAEYYVDV